MPAERTTLRADARRRLSRNFDQPRSYTRAPRSRYVQCAFRVLGPRVGVLWPGLLLLGGPDYGPPLGRSSVYWLPGAVRAPRSLPWPLPWPLPWLGCCCGAPAELGVGRPAELECVAWRGGRPTLQAPRAAWPARWPPRLGLVAAPRSAGKCCCRSKQRGGGSGSARGGCRCQILQGLAQTSR